MTSINTRKIEELMSDYHAADTRREQREIENDILELTVWGEQPDREDDPAFATFSKEQWDALCDGVEVADNVKEIESLLRRPYVVDL
jgi:hypothetical protein